MSTTSGPNAGDFPWSFVAEGGQNACYAFEKSDVSPANFAANNTTDLYRNKILRVAKSDILRGAIASGHTPLTPNDAECRQFSLIMPTLEASSSSCDANLRYILQVVRPLLGPQYVDVPQRATISTGFAANLWRVATSSGRVSQNRAKDWDCGEEERNLRNNHQPALNDENSNRRIQATLLCDHKKISIPGFSMNTSLASEAASMPEETCISVEIKPKAGYISCSPLIGPKRRIKLVRTKYWIHQQLMAKGCLKKGWGPLINNPGREIAVSTYNPLDLFSLEKNRIQHALHCLLEHPQNNLRVWYDEKIVIGQGAQELSNSQANSILRGAFPLTSGTCSGANDLQDAIVEAVSEILMKEPLLSRLHNAQKFDFIDTDGAILIWNHLVQLCDGNLNKAENLVNQYQGRIKKIDDIMMESKSRIEQNGLSALCNRIASFREEIKNVQADEKFLSKAYKETSELIGHLNKEESVQVLATWLLSLSMCDLSFFVTLSPGTTSYTTCTSNLSSESIFSTQTEDSLGSVVISHKGSAPAKYFYNVKVVDCEMKPSRKLRNREQSEAVMDDLHVDLFDTIEPK